MSAKESVFNFLIKTAWPAFKKYVWPMIEAHVIGLLMEMLEWLMKRIREMLFKQTDDRADEAMQKSKDAEARAANADTDIERAELRAEAATWKEVAEQYKRDLETMATKVDELSAQAKQRATEKVQAIRPELSSKSDNSLLSLSGKPLPLPDPDV